MINPKSETNIDKNPCQFAQLKPATVTIFIVWCIINGFIYKHYLTLSNPHNSQLNIINSNELLFEQLASGSFGDVYKVTAHDKKSKSIKKVFASKFIQIKKLDGKLGEIDNEIFFQTLAYNMDNQTRQHVVKIYNVDNNATDFHKESAVRIDLEYINGVELFDFYRSKRKQFQYINSQFTPKQQLCALLKSMGTILSKLNAQNIVFGDFKSRNIMLDVENTNKTGKFMLKLIDFGNAQNVSDIKEMRGTPNAESAIQYHLTSPHENERQATLEIVKKHHLHNTIDLVSLIITGINVWFFAHGDNYNKQVNAYLKCMDENEPVPFALDMFQDRVLMLLYEMDDDSVKYLFEKYYPNRCSLKTNFVCYKKFSHPYIWDLFLKDVDEVCSVAG